MNNEKLKKIILWCMAISIIFLGISSLLNYFSQKDMAEQQKNIDQGTQILNQIPHNASSTKQ